MSRKRNINAGQIPETMEGFAESLENNIFLKGYYQETITVGESCATIFMSNLMGTFLRENTFSTVYIEDSIRVRFKLLKYLKKQSKLLNKIFKKLI